MKILNLLGKTEEALKLAKDILGREGFRPGLGLAKIIAEIAGKQKDNSSRWRC